MVRRRHKKSKSSRSRRSSGGRTLDETYWRACALAEKGQRRQAQRLYQDLLLRASEPRLKALVTNDLGALSALDGDLGSARERFEAALILDEECSSAHSNLALLDENVSGEPVHDASSIPDESAHFERDELTDEKDKPNPVRVALVSFLFNWPSTGGGNVHSYELALFLSRAGFEVKHFYFRFDPWQIGNVPDELPFSRQVLQFGEAEWTVTEIQARLRQAVSLFEPDHVILTDSWNMKPLLAEAVSAYPYILRFQGMECLCPLNNVRLLVEGGQVRQCQLHQLATPKECCECLRDHGHCSGALHQAERALSGVGSPEYYERLLRAVREAEAILVVNPLQEAMISPYARSVRVVTAGMDPERFKDTDVHKHRVHREKTILFFAGLTYEWMKGFHVLRAACELLWQRRQDFELVATGDQPEKGVGPRDSNGSDPFTRYIGWLSQEDLARQLAEIDVLVMPTIAQEALGRTAVEAMAAGKPVLASRIGGLPFTVADGATGLLCKPGDPADLACKIETLLDDPDLRRRLGQAGRCRFEEHYAWPVIIDRHYRPLLTKTVKR